MTSTADDSGCDTHNDTPQHIHIKSYFHFSHAQFDISIAARDVRASIGFRRIIFDLLLLFKAGYLWCFNLTGPSTRPNDHFWTASECNIRNWLAMAAAPRNPIFYLTGNIFVQRPQIVSNALTVHKSLLSLSSSRLAWNDSANGGPQPDIYS